MRNSLYTRRNYTQVRITMIFNINNPWVVAIIGGALSAVLAGIILYFLFEYRKQQRSKTIRNTSLDEADSLLEKNMSEEALAIYKDILKAVSEKKEPVLLGSIRNNEGICYYNLAMVSNKEDNLTKAIQAYEDSLKIRTVEKYPVKYATTQNNLGTAYGTLAGVRDKKDNLTKAIQAYEDALKIRTVEKYPLDYAMTQNNLGAAYHTLAGVRDKEDNLTKAIQAYEDALKIYTVEEYPLYHKIVISNIEEAKQRI